MAQDAAGHDCLDAAFLDVYRNCSGCTGSLTAKREGSDSVWSAYKLSLRNGIRRRALVALTVLIGWTLALAVVRIAIPHVEAAPAQAVKAADTGVARAERTQ